MPPEAEYQIRTMGRREIDFAIELATKEGWNPGLHDADGFYAADPEGFLVGLLGGRPVGCISAVSYGGTFGFIGLYIVIPSHRGKGFGIRLWNEAMRRLAGHSIGLDGVFERQADYAKAGFRFAYRNLRFERMGGFGTVSAPDIRDAREVPFADLNAYDRQCFPADRSAFLHAWIRQPDSRALACVAEGSLQGYGVIRRCGRGFKVGPLFAEDRSIAEQLYIALAGLADSESPVYLDAPEMNPEALALATKYGMRQVFGTARMYAGQAPQLPLDRIFGVTSFELG